MQFSVVDKVVLRKFSLAENPLDIFDSFTRFQGETIFACRRWHGQGPDRVGEFLNSRVIVGGDDIDYGEEPRIFVHQGKLCVLCTMYSVEHGMRSYILELDRQGVWQRYVLVLPAGMEGGKNWSPFEGLDGRLHFIQTFSPLVLLSEIRREKGAIFLRAANSVGLTAEPGESGLPAHRGASNGLLVGNRIYGVGRTKHLVSDLDQQTLGTVSRSPEPGQTLHRPFGWCFDASSYRIELIPIVGVEWNPRFWIIDPTSFVRLDDDDSFYFYTTEAERNYTFPSDVAETCRYEVRLIKHSAEATKKRFWRWMPRGDDS